MAKVEFGDYAAFNSNGGIRFMHQGKMVSQKVVPPEVIAYLDGKLAEAISEPTPKFPMPTPEEKARLLAESLKVKPELQRVPEDDDRVVPDNEVPLSPEDFDEPIDEAIAVLEKHRMTPATLNETTDVDEFYEEPVNLIPPEDLIPQREPTKAMSMATSEFMESVSIHTAPLADIARALYDRFGIYTIYLGELPQNDEVNPLTGEAFSKYHLGIAYQAKIQADSRGLQDPTVFRKQMDTGRVAHENFQEQFVPVAHTLGEAREQDSFAFRTSVQSGRPQVATQIEHIKGDDGLMHAVQVPVPVSEHGGTAPSHFDEAENEQVIEPPIFGTKPIIKPNW